MTTVRTRFAPSPTGYLHIGGVRTALFNWLFARQHGGQFLLRIDDTDADRNVAAALEPILRGLRWLGLDWDEGPEVGGPHAPYFQSQRGKQYRAAVDALLASGHAYRDYATPEEIEQERAQAKGAFVYSRRWMAHSPADDARFRAEGRAAVVRLKMPRAGTLVLHDLVRGVVPFEWAGEQDHVIQRANGDVLYHLASVVDDAAMGITHVIRSEEHLSNTPRQVFIGDALGYPRPHYAHVPFVAAPGSGPDKRKLSKRELETYLALEEFRKLFDHGAAIARAVGGPASAATFNPVIVDFYERVGYEPDALINALALLGWSLDDKTEVFSRADLVRRFSLERVTQSPSRFDPAKLWHFQERYMAQLAPAELAARVTPFLQRARLVPDGALPADSAARIERVARAMGDRIKVAGDAITQADYFFRELPEYDPAAVDKRLRAPGARERLARLRARLAAVEPPFDAARTEAAMTAFLTDEGIKLAEVVHALRVAVTGRAVGPGIYDCLEIIGREGCLARIDHALARVAA